VATASHYLPKAMISGSASTSAADAGALLVSPDRSPPSLCPAAWRQLRGNPSLFDTACLLYMAAIDGDPLCVLAKCKD
jgi:hypothetical protein